MIKKLLSSTMLLLVVSPVVAGLVSQESRVSADTSIAQKDGLKSEEINLIKNGDFSDSGNHWLINGMYTPECPKGYALLTTISGPLSNAEYFDVEPNTKYKLEFDIKSYGAWTSQPIFYLLGNGSSVQFSKLLTSPKEWTTFSYEYTTDARINKLKFSISETRESSFVIDNVKFVKMDK